MSRWCWKKGYVKVLNTTYFRIQELEGENEEIQEDEKDGNPIEERQVIQGKEEATIIVADEDETTQIEKMLKGKEVIKDVAIT